MVQPMATNGNGAGPWRFQRGLGDDFIVALRELARKPSWFRDVLYDSGLIICIRDNYLNVYFEGQSIFKVNWNQNSKKIRITTHPKYLVDPALNKPVAFDGETFDVERVDALAKSYVHGETLRRMKKAAKVFSGVEKQGVHDVFDGNPNVIDLEIALSELADRDDKEGPVTQGGAEDKRAKGAKAKRIDIACFESIDGKVYLRFWEAKHYLNAELWGPSGTSPPVVDQVSDYRKLVEKYCNDLLRSYRVVAENLVEIAKMAGRKDKLSELIVPVAEGEEFFLDTPPNIGVVIFGFSGADKASSRHKLMEKNLRDSAGLKLKLAGQAKKIRLGPMS
jgi:hypothetical protein